MVDWKKLRENWDQLPGELQDKIIDLFEKKSSDKLEELFKKDPEAKKLYDFLHEAPPVEEKAWAFYVNDQLVNYETFKKEWEKLTDQPFTLAPSFMKVGETTFEIKRVGAVELPEAPTPEVPTLAPEVTKRKRMPTVVPGLSKIDEQRVRDQFYATLSKEGIRITTGIRAEFRHEMRLSKEEVAELPTDEAYKKTKERLDDLAQEIMTREVQRRTLRRAVRPPRRPPIISYGEPGKEEEEIPPAIVARIPPRTFPTAPLSDLPFPRRPTSEEQTRLWDAFAYILQEKGMSYWDYAKLFEERIWNITFKDWDMVRDRFNQLIEVIASGEELPELWVWKGVPPPSLEFLYKPTIEPTEARAQAIRHFTSVVIRNARTLGRTPTLEELRVTLEQFGIFHVPFEEIKDAIMAGWESKDVYFTGITLEELNRFLET